MRKQIFILLLVAFALKADAQNRILEGIVLDSMTNKPLQSATIHALQSTYNSIADNSGRFSLTVNNTDTLIINSLGYLKKELVLNRRNTSVTIQLTRSEAPSLQDVVLNTGYQSIPKERSTGSFVHINDKLINRSVGSNILDRLRGVTSSLLFDDKTNSHTALTIRGLGTLTTSDAVSSPLIVVDNFPYQGDINNINPNDVKSITILRDAAAASIWGAKAGNGVVVITTKKGRSDRKLRVSASSSFTVADKPDLFAISQMSSSDFIDVEESLFDKGYYDGILEDTYEYPVVSPVVEILQKQRLGQITKEDAVNAINQLRDIDVRNGYLKYFYRRSTLQQHTVSIAGGTDKLSYYEALGYDRNMTSLKGNQDNRVTWRSTITLRPVTKLSIQNNTVVSLANASINSPLPIYSMQGSVLYPYASFANRKGQVLPIERDYSASFKDTAGVGRLLDWQYFPIDELNNADNSTQRMDVIIGTRATYSFLPFLKGELNYQFESQHNTSRNYYSQQTYFTRNLINLFTNLSNNNVLYGVPMGGILDLSDLKSTTHDARAQLDYNQVLSGKHEITAIAGIELRQTRTTGHSSRTYGFDENHLTSLNVNFDEQYPILDDLPYGHTIPNSVHFTELLDRMVSMYANASYSFKHRYVVSLSGRKDASNILGVETNNKWKPLWSAGAAWNFSKEPFYHFKFLPYLKLRMSYGHSGNVNNSISALTTLTYFTTNGTEISNLPYAQVSNPPNPDLTWENIATFNAAVDFTLKSDLLNGSIEYYEKKSSDLIAAVPADITLAGSASFFRNSANLNGRGIDVTLNAHIFDRQFKWLTTFLFSYDRVKVSKYNQTVIPRNAVGNDGSITPIIGQAPYTIVSYKWGGLDEEGNPIGFLEGKKSNDYTSIISKAGINDLTISGSAVPQYFGGLMNTFDYKGIELSFNIVYKMGFYFRKPTINYSNLFNYGISNADYTKRWQKPGDEKNTTVPRLMYPADYYRDRFYQLSTATVENGSNIRLQDIRVSYNIPLKNRFFKAAQLYLYANNLGIIWRQNGDHIDPEAYNTFPSPFSLTVGFQLDF